MTGAEGGIRFDPPLPEAKREAITAINMPPGFRILFRMKGRFYPDLTMGTSFCAAICGDSDDDLTMVYDPLIGKDHVPSDTHVVCLVAIGDRNAGEMGELPDAELGAAALRRIDEMFDGQGSANLIGAPVVQNWTKEPYIFGAYSFRGPTSHREELARSEAGGRVIFAGEHTCLKYFSTVQGSALEGRRAAMEAVLGGRASAM